MKNKSITSKHANRMPMSMGLMIYQRFFIAVM